MACKVADQRDCRRVEALMSSTYLEPSQNKDREDQQSNKGLVINCSEHLLLQRAINLFKSLYNLFKIKVNEPDSWIIDKELKLNGQAP